MLAKHGQRDEARAMLADIYKCFIEGFDHCRPEGGQVATGAIERLNGAGCPVVPAEHAV
jgi:hypothetical protein